MNETEILKAVSTPGAIALVLVWMNTRMNRLERLVDGLAVHIGAPSQKKRVALWPLFVVLCAIASTALSGCAIVNQRVTSPEGAETTSHIIALWPATSSADKASAKQTKTTQGIGVEGVTTDGGGTNMVNALSELRLILQTVAAGAAK